MKTIEDISEDSDNYTGELKAYVLAIFQYASQISEMRKLLTSLKEKAEGLKQFILTEEEEAENNKMVSAFNEKMQSMVISTFAHLNIYQYDQWKELFDDGEDNNGDNSGTHQKI